jgi:hypothetical protein
MQISAMAWTHVMLVTPAVTASIARSKEEHAVFANRAVSDKKFNIGGEIISVLNRPSNEARLCYLKEEN